MNLRLNLGANDRRFPGFLSVDVCEPADVLVDLSQPWPWADRSVEEVLAYDIFEHLPNKRQTMNELWRVLQPGGIATIQVPDASDGDGGHCDPTHCSYWTRSDFEYYERGQFERERFRQSSYYGVQADFKILNLDSRGQIPRVRYERRRGGYVYEIQVKLEAVK